MRCVVLRSQLQAKLVDPSHLAQKAGFTVMEDGRNKGLSKFIQMISSVLNKTVISLNVFRKVKKDGKQGGSCSSCPTI